MPIFNDFFKYIKQKKVLRLKDSVKDTYINTDENALQASVEEAIKIINENPEIAKPLLEKMVVDPEIPNQITEKTTIDVIENSKFDETTKIASVKSITNMGEQLKDETIGNIIDVASISPDIDRNLEIEMIKQIDNEEEKQNRVHDILKRIYSKLDSSKTDFKLVDELNDLNFVHSCKKLKTWELKNVAKKIAINYANFGYTNLDFLSQIVPVDKMLQFNMPELVSTEYSTYTKNNPSNFPYVAKDLKGKILKELAKHVAAIYDQEGDIIIPQSNQMRKLTDEEKNFFISEIQKYSEEDFSPEKIASIQEKIAGNFQESDNAEIISEMLSRLSKKEQNTAISQIKQIITNPKLRLAINSMSKHGLLDSFKNSKEEDINKSIALFSETFNKYLQSQDKLLDNEDLEK